MTPEQAAELVGTNSDYTEFLFAGIIDGFTSGFNADCRSGLLEVNSSLFSVMDTWEIWLPKNTAKFNIASVQLTEAMNVVYAFCDTTSLFEELSKLVDFSDPDQFIVLASRIGGTFINTWGTLTTCIKRGQETNDGYMVGSCGA